MPLKSSSSYSLGPLPWSDETLVAAVWRDFKTAPKLVDEHPGRDLYDRATSLRSILRILNRAAQSFAESLERFHAEVHDGHLFWRSRKADLMEFEYGFQENLYVFASSAITLVDQSRALSEKIELPGYSERVEGIFASSARHRFIQELRNDLIHVTLHQPQWQISRDQGQSASRFMLWPDDLLRSGRYNSLARSYVNEHPEGIDLGELIKGYCEDVNDFQSWLQTTLDLAAGESIADYRRCANRIKAVSSRSWWNVVFTQFVLPAGRDPYQFLERCLTPGELEEVNNLPFKSKAQVDLIISLVDEYDACDGDLRAVIYKAFGMHDESSELT